MGTLVIIITFISLAFFIFIIYFVIKQIGFFINATRLYRRMIKQQKLIANLLIDIRDNTKNVTNVTQDMLEDEHDTQEESGFYTDIKGNNLKVQSNLKQEDVSLLKDKVGEDAVTYAMANDNGWLCVCGTKNSLKASNCTKCHRNRNNVLKNYSYEALNISN